MDREARRAHLRPICPAGAYPWKAGWPGDGNDSFSTFSRLKNQKRNKTSWKPQKPGLPVHGPVTWGISGSFCAFMGLLGGRQSIETGRERGCEEMIKHFFTAPFIILFPFIMLFCKSPRSPLPSKDKSRGGCRRYFSKPWRGRPCLRRGHRPCRFQRGQREGRGIW